jgi:alpha-L-fucosidase
MSHAEPAMTRGQRIEWWRDARFGMFIHWGLYAIPAGTWKDKKYETGYSEWIMFEEKIPVAEYSKLAGKFNPVKFDAAQWAAIAKQAGMKYVVLTAKHHDGFSMFDSKLTDFDVVDATPFKRDVTRELADASRAAGLRFGCYYSVDRDWHRPQGPGNSYKQANTWDFPDSQPADFDKYFAEFAKPQVEELLTRYPVELLWFDGIDMKSDAQAQELHDTIRRLNPACIINSRIKGCKPPKSIPPPYADYLSTGDNEIADRNIGFEWENPASMNTSYGYNANDHNWVDAGEIIRRLADIVSKGGNYLLNVGPTAEGLIPQPCIESLADVGRWIEVHGEAIHGTMPWRVFRDGTDGDEIRYTSKGSSLYAIGISLTGTDVKLRDLGKSALTDRAIGSVSLLGYSDSLQWRQEDDALVLPVPEKRSGPHALVYRIDFRN